MSAVIVAEGVHRHFGDTRALDGVDLVVEPHQIFSLLGPNGSGKTTLLNQCQGLDRPTSGRVTVLGLEPIADRAALTQRMGTQLQESAMIPRLTVREALTTFASFYPRSRDVDELLHHLGLSQKASARLERLSGGQRQRVFIGLALLHDPELLFFDELTSAVDPQARLAIWDILRDLRDQGRTIVLTTHSMEEAQALSDRVAIIDAGRIIAEDTPANLIAEHAGGVTLRLDVGGYVDTAAIGQVPGVADVQFANGTLTVEGNGDFATAVAALLAGSASAVSGMTVTQRTLEDVFLRLTGRRMREGQ